MAYSPSLRLLLSVFHLLTFALCNAIPKRDVIVNLRRTTNNNTIDGAPVPSVGEDIATYLDDLSTQDLTSGDASQTENTIVVSEPEDATWLDALNDSLNITEVRNTSSAQVARSLINGHGRLTHRAKNHSILSRANKVAFDLSTTFNNTETGDGYNIGLPAGTCASTKISGFIDPVSGVSLNDPDLNLSIFVYAYEQARKTEDEWVTFTRTNVQNLLDYSIGLICDGNDEQCSGGLKHRKRYLDSLTTNERALAVRQQGSRFALGTGFWTSVFLATGSGCGITFGSYVGILSLVSNHEIGDVAEAALYALVGLIVAVLTAILFRLDSRTAFGGYEIILLNFFTVVASAVLGRPMQLVAASAVSHAMETLSQNQQQSGPFYGSCPSPAPASGSNLQLANMC